MKKSKFWILHSLAEFIDNTALDSTDVEELIEFLNKYKIEDEYILSIIGKSVTSYYSDLLDDNKSSIEVSRHIRHSYSGEYGESGYEIDYDGIQVELEDLLESFISDFENKNLNNIYIDRSIIIANIDLEKIGDDFLVHK
ncbi:MAG: hypothetical protein IPN67_16695 [Bacteroidales bacterium]|nr:hypothetical protein [Bacteroidales bacterium]